MAIATVTSKGQVTIPVEVRRKLGIRVGTRVEFLERSDGSYQIVAATGTVRALRGVITHQGASVGIDEMDDAIADAVAEKYRSL